MSYDSSENEYIIAGRQPVIEALKSGRAIEKVIILFGLKGEVVDKIRQLAQSKRIPVVEANKERFRDLVNDATAQGVVAIAGSKEYVELDDILQIAVDRDEPPFILILDEIEDPHNLGALIRTAECAGIHGVIIPKHGSASVNHTVVKTSAGASSYMPVAKVTNIAQTIDDLKEIGVWIVGTDSEADKLYNQIDFNMATAIVIGNEGSGMRRLVKAKCDFMVKIPIFGRIESLNASVAGGLIMYEAARGRKGLRSWTPAK